MPEYPEILTQSRFYLELSLDGSQDFVDALFMECSGFQVSQDVIEVSEVTPQYWGKSGKTRGRVVRTKLPGNMSYTNITLKRGLTTSKTFWEWLDAVQSGSWSEQRRDGSLVVYDQASDEQCRLEFQGAWPVSYKVSDLDVKSGDFNIEEVEIVIEELKRVS